MRRSTPIERTRRYRVIRRARTRRRWSTKRESEMWVCGQRVSSFFSVCRHRGLVIQLCCNCICVGVYTHLRELVAVQADVVVLVAQHGRVLGVVQRRGDRAQNGGGGDHGEDDGGRSVDHFSVVFKRSKCASELMFVQLRDGGFICAHRASKRCVRAADYRISAGRVLAKFQLRAAVGATSTTSTGFGYV